MYPSPQTSILLLGGFGFLTAALTIRSRYVMKKAKQEREELPLPVLGWDEQKISADIQSSWEKPLRDTPVSIDLPRLASKFSVSCQSCQLRYLPNPTADRATGVREVLVALCTALNQQQLGDDIQQRWDAIIDDPSEVAHLLPRFFDEVIGRENAVTRVLKACTQATLAAPAMALKQCLQPALTYKDKRGLWTIHVEAAGEKVEVCHKKREISWDANMNSSKGVVEFEWVVRVIFNADVSELESVHVIITDILFSDLVPEDQRERFMQTLADNSLLDPGTIPRELKITTLP